MPDNADGLEIADLREDEIGACVALWQAAKLTRPWNNPNNDISLALTRPDATILAGHLDGRLVATAMVGCDGHRGWVYYLAVAEECRGRGLGSAMMDAAERWLATRGVPKIQLMVRGDNEGAIGFYEAIGYRHNDVVVLSRRLDGT